MRYLLVVVFVGSIMAVATAQTRVLTNSDLEKYRLEREKAEREYRENYARRGFPSPEELEKRRRQDDIENQQFVLRLNEQLAERERIESQRRSMVYYRIAPSQIAEPAVESTSFWTYGRGYRNPFLTPKRPSGYLAGGQFWPTPVRTPMPVITHPPVRIPPKPPRKNPK